MRHIAITILLLLTTVTAFAQNDLIIGQYIHNRYAVNPSFAGSRECLSVFGSFRKQWAGIESTPRSILLTGHAPMKNEKLTLGVSLYNQAIHQSSNSGVMVSVGYRTRVTRRTWLSLALQPGVSLRNTDWKKVSTIMPDDDAFSDKESSAAPLLGFGASWYGRRFFSGLSVVSLFVSDDFDQRDAKFAPADATYIATGGYLFDLDNEFKIQPSVMASYSQKDDATIDISCSVIYNDFAWLNAGYRTNGEAIVGLAVQALPQLRVAYNYEFTTGDLNGNNSGSHEISLQYDLKFNVRTVGPKFF